MTPDREAPGSTRSAHDVNAEIRELLIRTGGWLSADDRALYERLVAEWALAVRAEVVEAA